MNKKQVLCYWVIVIVSVSLIIYISQQIFTPKIGPPILVTIIDTGGNITDKDAGSADNFKNGKASIELILIKRAHNSLEHVLDPTTPMQVTISGHNKTWSVPTIDLRENSGKTVTNYGENIECDGVVAGPSGWTDNLYVKIIVPTTSGGGVEEGATIRIDMWPTTDVVSAVDGTISSAGFDNVAIDDWWDNKDTINIYFTGKGYSLSLTGFDGAYLIGTEIDE